jgi:hypothetical protein
VPAIVGDPLGRVAPRSPRRLLEELAAASGRLAAGGKPRPRVTLHMVSGRDLTGRLVGTGEDGGSAVALVHVGGDADVAHVRIDQVAAVTVHEPAAPARPVEAPGRLDLARRAAAREKALAAALGQALPIALDGAVAGDADLHAVAALLAVLGDALAGVLGDPLGVEAIRQLGAIQIGASDEPTAVRVGAELQLRGARDEARQWTASELRAAIERAV